MSIVRHPVICQRFHKIQLQQHNTHHCQIQYLKPFLAPEFEVKVKVWLALAVYLGGPEVNLVIGSLHVNKACPL